MVYQHLDFISAIYAGVNVVTTVGLYAPNISQMTDTEKIVLIITIIFAVIFHDRSENLIIGLFEIKKEIKIKDLPSGILPLAIIEEDGKLNPYFEKDTLLKKGEKLVVLGDPNLFKKVKEVLGE